MDLKRRMAMTGNRGKGEKGLGRERWTRRVNGEEKGEEKNGGNGKKGRWRRHGREEERSKSEEQKKEWRFD